MKKGILVFILLAIIGTLFLMPSFYRNRWNAVDPSYYEDWQTRYDRLVVARLVETRQNGFFSASGFMGLGDETMWGFTSKTNRHQFETYLNNGNFQFYLVYRSNPGFQGYLYGAMDKLFEFSGAQKLKIFRGFTALLSAISLGLLFASFSTEFGFLAGIATLIFSAISIWLVLPAGSIFWNLWAFFLPFITSIFVLAESTKQNNYNSAKIHILLFIATLLRILFSGFDVITTGMIMTTVPFVFFAIRENWRWKLFITRFIQSGMAILMGAVTGLLIMSAQIIINDGNAKNAISYILNRFGSHAEGNSKIYINPEIKPTKIGALEIIEKYLNVAAIRIHVGNINLDVLYWHIVLVFAIFTIAFLLFGRQSNQHPYSPKALALIVSTWYSISAPFSWYLLFRPHSIIHTHVNSMGWQMPFTLLGFAMCGFVITNLFKRKTI